MIINLKPTIEKRYFIPRKFWVFIKKTSKKLTGHQKIKLTGHP
jgi:hypothetical protein